MDIISTDEAPAGEGFAYWREVHSKLWVPYDLGCDPSAESGFRARVGISDLGQVQATLLTATRYSIRRTPKLVRRSDPEVFMLGCLTRGGGAMTQDGRESEYTAGDLVLYDTSRSYTGDFTPGVNQLLLLVFPRTLLPLPPRDVRRLSATRIPGATGIGALSSHFLRQLATRMNEFTKADTAMLATLTIDVLTTALANALDVQGVVPPHTRRRALVAQIHAFIREHLGDQGLTPEAIASAHHISLRYLHKLFHQDGSTVAGWVRERRLERCRRDLTDPHLATVPINTIASRWGFTSPAHFSQVFRTAYGVSPRQFRQLDTTVRGD